MHGVSSKRFFSEVEYLAMERVSDRKHEYYRGEIFAMAGGSPQHNEITLRFGAAVIGALRAGCRAFSPDQRVRVSDAGLYTYPDVSVACSPRFEADTLLNPQMFVEVLSEATEAYDRGTKFDLYKQIASLTDYVLASQDSVRVEHFARQGDGTWKKMMIGAGQRLLCGALEREVAVDDVYRGVLDRGQ